MAYAQRSQGRFFGRRVNCEQVPLLPAWAVARVLDDPEEVPYLLVWKSPSDGTVQEAVRIVPFSETPGAGGLDLGIDWTGSIAIERNDGAADVIRTLVRALPRNGGSARLLICPCCQIPRRALYGWEPGGRHTHSAVRSSWQCRSCAGLRYASEGGALVQRGRGRVARMLEASLGRSRAARPEPWYPADVVARPDV
jgi:hypothetical protein